VTRALCVLLLGGCAVDSGLEAIEGSLVVRGTDVRSFEGRDGWQIELERAELAFGPVYLCSGVQAGDLCETARGELLETVVIDALDAEAHEVARFAGLDGPVRSAMWDYGITWSLSATRAEPSAAAEMLEGSVFLAGIARNEEGEVLPFAAQVPVAPNLEGRVVVRASDLFEHTLADGDVLSITVDPSLWLTQVRFDDLLEAARPEGQPASFEEGTQPYRSVSNALTTRAQPRLEWNP